MTSLKRRWPAVRALLVSLVAAHAVVFGLQIPALSEERLQRDYWKPLVSRVEGLTGDSEEEARRRLARYSLGLRELQADLSAPLAWCYRLLRAGQTWNMFSGAEKRSFQMFVEMRRADSDAWETLYTVHDADARFERERIEYRRVRAAYIAFDEGTPGPYYPFCRWVAKRAFYTYPDAAEVRVRMRRLDYRDRAERLAHVERTLWANGTRITRAQFERDMRALHE